MNAPKKRQSEARNSHIASFVLVSNEALPCPPWSPPPWSGWAGGVPPPDSARSVVVSSMMAMSVLDQSAGSMAQAYMPNSVTSAPRIPIHTLWKTAP